MSEDYKPHQHFKMSDEHAHHFVTRPHKLALLIGIFLTIVLCVAVIVFLNHKNQNNVSNSVPAEIPPVDQSVLTNLYKNNLTVIVQNYLSAWSTIDTDAQACLSLVNTSATQVLNLTVPKDFKELQLKLIIILDQQKTYCQALTESTATIVQNDWQKILTDYLWLATK